jgi:TPP-dependent pyruvate/acetoin dehydrogenase alpha subunit
VVQLARATGYIKGKGGSMHIAYFSVGTLGVKTAPIGSSATTSVTNATNAANAMAIQLR